MKALQKMVDAEAAETLLYVDCDDIMMDPNQPRTEFDEASIEEMAESLRATGGNIVPIEIRENPAGSPAYIMTDGERRWRGAQRVPGLKLKAVLYQGAWTAAEIHDRQFIVNYHRDNMSLADQAAYLLRRKDELGSVEAVSERVQLSAARIYKIIGTTQLEGVAAQARDQGLSRDAETLTGLQALEKRDPTAANSLVTKAAAEGGKIARSAVTKAARESRNKTAASPGKAPELSGENEKAKPTGRATHRIEPTREAAEQPGGLAVFVRLESDDAQENARWEALSELGAPYLCAATIAEAAAHVVVIAGSKADEFRAAGVRVDRVGARDGT
jgi:ParB family chromosome partitioning protein